MALQEMDNPAPDWLSDRSWMEIQSLGSLPKFADFVDDFNNHLDSFKDIFDSSEPHR